MTKTSGVGSGLNKAIQWLKITYAKVRKFLLIPLVILLPVAIYILFFTTDPVMDPEVDVLLGRQAINTTLINSIEYPVLNRSSGAGHYQNLEHVVNQITGGNSLKHEEIFKYDSLIIIDNDNLFKISCYPGGFLMVSTGAINKIQSKELLAGMLAHEISHAEQRHVALSLQKEFGQKTILKFAVLATGTAASAVGSKIIRILTQLNYSKVQEIEADSLSVTYLANTGYPCDGMARVFDVLDTENMILPEFLRDQPNSELRRQKIQSVVSRLNCNQNEVAE